jgi:hypothetical protein
VSPPNHDGGVGSLHSMSQATTSASSSIRKNSETDPGPLGLNVIYTPENGHKADIIFIHGLGGSSRMTWSKYKNPELFWPLTFLPLEPDVCLARILSFGYHANFRKAGNVSTAVLDFAKELLYDLKYATDEQGEDLNMGNVSKICVSSLDMNLTTLQGASSFCCPQYGRTHSQGGKVVCRLPLIALTKYRHICKAKMTPNTKKL